MGESISNRLRTAIDFVKNNGLAKNEYVIAGALGVTKSTLSMAASGSRTPTWGMLLKFCDTYPISFDWIRTGEGRMIKGDRERELLNRIEELENKIKELQR